MLLPVDTAYWSHEARQFGQWAAMTARVVEATAAKGWRQLGSWGGQAAGRLHLFWVHCSGLRSGRQQQAGITPLHSQQTAGSSPGG